MVTECRVETCAYNSNRRCHAYAITVGNTAHPRCDTFLHTSIEGGDPSATGRVGACKMSGCRHNVRLECQAPGVSIGYQGSEVDCLTYIPA